MLKIFGFALVGAITAFVLKAFGWRGAPLAAIAAVLLILSCFSDTLDKVREIFSVAGEGDELFGAGEYLMKILGIGYLSGICSDVCRELGEAGIASAVTTVARLEAVAVLLPLISEIITLGLELVK